MKSVWVCPYCRQRDSYERARAGTTGHGVDVGRLTRATLTVMGCHNPECYRATLLATLFERDASQERDQYVLGSAVQTWRLIPESRARAWPEYVPEFVVSDYNEACAIENASPKASAAMSRRCLQSIIRDFFQIAKARLVDEIDALEGKVGPDVQAALHALREIGNVGAHPERDPNTIVEIEPGEATAMIDLLEVLIEETYLARHERDTKIARVSGIAAAKKKAGGG